MGTRLAFYVKHSIRSLRREVRRSLFAAFAIAAGVAAIVGLQSLSLTIEDSVTADIRATHRGDVVVSKGDDQPFSSAERQALERIASRPEYLDGTFFLSANPDRPSFAGKPGVFTGAPQWFQPYLVEPAKFPLYGEILAVEPKGVPLGELLRTPSAIALSENVASRLDLSVGDEVLLENTSAFTLTGVVPNESTGGPLLAPYSVPPLPWFGFLSIEDRDARTIFGAEDGEASVLFIKTRDEASAESLALAISDVTSGLDVETSAARVPEVQDTTDILSRFILVAGLVSLAIGSIGILNTMLVVVRRRTTEIAVLKALGMKGRQVTILFMVEGAILGVAGSAAGIVLGILLSLALNGFSEQFLQAEVPWKLQVTPIFTGLVVGVIATTVFGFLPMLAASRVRPNQVLQPQESIVPRAGRLTSLAVVLILTAVMGIVASVFLEDLLIGILGAYGALIVLSLLTLVLLAVVWLVGKVPDFGSVNLKLSLRGLTRQKGRAASTLLAMVIGLSAMGAIVILGSSIKQLIDEQLEETLGGNVFVLLTDSSPELRDRAREGIVALEEVDSVLETHTFEGVTIAMINGESFSTVASRRTEGEVFTNRDGTRGTSLVSSSGENPGQAPEIAAGRALTAEDNGTAVIVARARPWWRLGDRVGLSFEGATLSFELVGISAERLEGGFGQASLQVAFGAIPDSVPRDTVSFFLGISETRTSTVAAELNRTVPGAITIETAAIASVFNEILDRFAVFPTVLSALALFTGAVIIANSVALATIERRREIATMKAVGAKGSRILTFLLLENAILGLAGGGIGVALSLIILIVFNRSSPEVSASPDPTSIIVIMGVGVGVALAAALLSAWPASREKPLNVLRYE